MTFLWATFMVGNLEKTLKFYEETLGIVALQRIKPDPEREIAFLGEGETKLEFIQVPKAPASGKEGVSIGIKVDSTEAKKVELEGKGFETTPIISPNPHMRYFFIMDPNGINVQFVELI